MPSPECKATRCECRVEWPKQFCDTHWNMLTRPERERLILSFGTSKWPLRLSQTIARLEEIELSIEQRLG